MREEVVLLGSRRAVVGILTRPDGDGVPGAPGVLLLNSGWVHRTGPNRIYVQLARRLAAAGFPVVRLDLPGVGDSPPSPRDLPLLEGVLEDLREVMGDLSSVGEARRFVPMGICSGADVSFRLAAEDERVVGAVMVNANVLDPEAATTADTHSRRRLSFYLRRALFDAGRWRRLLTGKTAYGGLLHTLASGLWRLLSGADREPTEARARVARDLDRMADRRQRLLFIFSEGDAGLDSFRLLVGEPADRLEVPGDAGAAVLAKTDHLFTRRRSREELFDLILRWMEAFAGAAGAARSSTRSGVRAPSSS